MTPPLLWPDWRRCGHQDGAAPRWRKPHAPRLLERNSGAVPAPHGSARGHGERSVQTQYALHGNAGLAGIARSRRHQRDHDHFARRCRSRRQKQRL